MVSFVIIFLGWALFLPIKSASVAEGMIVLDFSKKTIQHLEGGIIDEILVKEGQMVNEGDKRIIEYDYDRTTIEIELNINNTNYTIFGNSIQITCLSIIIDNQDISLEEISKKINYLFTFKKKYLIDFQHFL